MTNLVQHFLEHYHNNPDKSVLVMQQAGQPDRTITFAELFNGALAYARAYQRAGLQPGEVIILILPHGSDLIFAFWGAIFQGAIPSIMPFLTEKLQPERYRADIAALIEVTRPGGLFTYPDFKQEVYQSLNKDSPVHAILTCESIAEQVYRFPEMNDLSIPGMQRLSSQITLLQHSSGTTGLQKGVALSHQAILNQLENYQRVLDFSAEDVVVSWLPLYHDMGLIAGFVMPILVGAKLVLMSPFDWVRAPYRLLHSISQYRGTFCWLPNFAYNFCASKILDRDIIGIDLSSLRGVINCSEPVHLESHQRFSKRFFPYGLPPGALGTCYAMAENVFAVTQSILGQAPTVDTVDQQAFQVDHVARPAVAGQNALNMLSSGHPLPNVTVRVLDDQGCDLPDRYVGEIALKSDCMLNEYYNRPEINQKAFLDGWYLTGDYGYRLGNELFVSGRKKDMIIVGGKNIYPQDLETLAMEVPGVHPGRVAAFGIFNDETGTEEVVLVAEVETTDSTEQESIGQAIRKAVTRGSAVALRHVHLVPAGWLIKTSSGKTARAANREKYLSQNTSQAEN